MSQFDHVRGQGGKSHKDDLGSLQFETPRSLGRFRPFIRRAKFRAMNKSLNHSSSREGINSSLTGSSKNLLEPSKLMSLQEDAKSRRISSEVMKQRLYDSVVTSPRRRRMSSSLHAGYYDEDLAPAYYSQPGRLVMSMPATPATSQRTTPAHSPTTQRKFMFGLFSRGNTPYAHTPEDELMDTSDLCEGQGIASIFSPTPRCIPGNRWPLHKDQSPKRQSEEPPTDGDLLLQDVPKPKQGRRSEPE